jgi:hypothetical protein
MLPVFKRVQLQAYFVVISYLVAIGGEVIVQQRATAIAY